MKYPDPKHGEKLKTRSLLINEFMYGINDDTGEIATDGDLLRDCVNMEYSGNTFKSRKGFKAKSDAIIYPSDYSTIDYLPFTITETVYFSDDVPYNLAYYCTGYNDAATLAFYLVDSGGNIFPSGSIEFSRTDSEHFYIPTNVFFMVAQPIDGNGVFALVYRESRYDSLCTPYEAQDEFSNWVNVSNSYYVPTVLTNGRGEQYHLAQENANANLPEPRRLEELNLLNGEYKSYFSSDGYSSHFRLPYGNLSLYSSFSCRIYTAPGTYTEWTVAPVENHKSATFLGAAVHLYLDRTLGIVRFSKNSQDYAIPVMASIKNNNIVFNASVGADEFYEAIVSSKGAVSLDNRIYCFGGRGKTNCIFCSKSNNPFYFPQSSKLFLGDGTTPVTALKVQNGKLIAFKPGETYRVITSAENEAGFTVTLPETTEYIKGDTLSAQTIDNSIGCVAADTVRLCGNRLVWLAGDGNVYALATTTYGNTTNIFRISQPLGHRLEDALASAQNVFAVTNKGQYMLFADNTVFVMNHRVRGFGYMKTYYAHDDEIKSPAWYIWNLPEGMSYLGGAVINGSPVLISVIDEELYYYTSVIDGKTDIYLIKENGEIKSVSTPFSSEFTTKMLDCKDRYKKKSLYSVLISSLENSLIKLKISDGKRSFSQNFRSENGLCYAPLDCGIPEFKLISLSLSSDEAMSVESICIVCKTLAGAG